MLAPSGSESSAGARSGFDSEDEALRCNTAAKSQEENGKSHGQRRRVSYQMPESNSNYKMKTRNLFCLFICLLTSAIFPATTNAANTPTVPRWQTRDLAFKSTRNHDNPFVVEFSAEVTGPGGIHFSQLGFYDGEGTWKIRLGPNAPGKWSVRTVSSDPQLDGKTVGDIICVEQKNPRVHGGLLVHPEHPHHFIREDGTRFFYSGFECDWLFALDLAACERSYPKPRSCWTSWWPATSTLFT
jgi:hypothetical protein